MLRSKPLITLAVTLFCMIIASAAWSAEFVNLSAQELNTRMQNGEKLLVIDPLSDLEYNEGHIPGSVNIPFHLLATTDQLPADKAVAIVTYCLGPKCVFYKQSAERLAELGYTNVMTFKAGLPGWIKAGYPVEQTGALEKTKIQTMNVDELKAGLDGVVIVDVRPPSLYEMGWIPGSVKIPLGLLTAEYTQIPKGKRVVVVVDHAGKQVLTAGRFLASNGYGEVKRLQGGLMAWSQKGYPLER
ncbi:rhodanese-like domain-containing protein [Desulfosarcina cetonica]|uniref:rhodanese-like domain-containing protein n=1 Tax=Desulfosarcina cetonica TaxID=90730 RepID=UPI00155DD1BE|nr:rhodanese-like domain-containing protein [Desulfosarcina cetonica]